MNPWWLLYVIAGVMAIESRFKPNAKSGKCRGLMQLHLGTARAYGVNPYVPRENVMGGAMVLADLLRKTKDNLPRAISIYNGTGNRAYLREVLKAIAQARKSRREN